MEANDLSKVIDLKKIVEEAINKIEQQEDIEKL